MQVLNALCSYFQVIWVATPIPPQFSIAQAVHLMATSLSTQTFEKSVLDVLSQLTSMITVVHFYKILHCV